MARYDMQLMVQVAKMYYSEGLKQDNIAYKLGISRSSISLILTQAKEMGLIEINVKDPCKNVQDLSDKLAARFGLENCLVVSTVTDSIHIINRVIVSQGADFAEKLLESHSTVGIAWGLTCYEFMLAFKNRRDLRDINVIPLIGGTSRISSEYQLNEMVRMFATTLYGTPTFIYAPAIAESIADKELYMQSASMKAVMKKWDEMDVAIISAGAPPENHDYDLLLDPVELQSLGENRAVGDICARRLNIYGQFIENDYSQRIMGISEEQLRRIKKVVCIAAGAHKVLAVIAALRTGIINYLVTDESTARSVLNLTRQTDIGSAGKHLNSN
jgi:deoxyribonucleoside regulator